ncbi:MAG: hypothetical protein HZA90_03270 [Verrucomicrobia bacterium]|nr:hypothetical protein [Verrucomicrobiota bacterium]
MKTNLWLTLATVGALTLGAAESDTQSAVKKAADTLTGKGSYSWSLVNKPEGSEEGFQMSTDGKTEKGGFTTLTIRFGENEFQAVRKGEKVAVQRDGQWQTPEDMDERGARMTRRLQTAKFPAEEAAELAGKVTELKAGDGGLYSGDLTEAAVKEIFSRWGRGGQAPQVSGAKGWVKFWVKDGVLAKYQFNQRGTITGQDGQERDMNRTTTVEIKDVGTTKVSVPDDVKKKLS